MTLLLRLLSLIWLVLGLANLFIAPKVEPAVAGPIIFAPKFNALVFLGSFVTVFLAATFLGRSLKKAGKKTPGKMIDPKNEVRLRELRALRGRGLVGMREYRRKREEILKGL